MKKSSKKQRGGTVAESKPAQVVGLDLGDRYSRYCVLSGTGEVDRRGADADHCSGNGETLRQRAADADCAGRGHPLSLGKPVVEKLWTPGDRSQPAQDPHA